VVVIRSEPPAEPLLLPLLEEVEPLLLPDEDELLLELELELELELATVSLSLPLPPPQAATARHEIAASRLSSSVERRMGSVLVQRASRRKDRYSLNDFCRKMSRSRDGTFKNGRPEAAARGLR
jgi:hypothetical protein